MANVQTTANPTSKRETARKSASVPKSKPVNGPRRATKKAQLIKLLSSENGATVETLSRKLGWLAHTTRAALTRLRQEGHRIERHDEGNRAAAHYRISKLGNAATKK